MNIEPVIPAGPEPGNAPNPPAIVGADPVNRGGRARRPRPGTARVIPPEDGKLLNIFWLLALGFFGYGLVTYSSRPAFFTEAALLVAFFALLPAYLWCRRLAPGLPLFPFFAGTFLLTHALQFLLAASDSTLGGYPAGSIWRAAFTVSGFLLLGTVVWLGVARRPRRLPAGCRSLASERGTSFMFLGLIASTLVTVFDQAGWLDFLQGGAKTLVRHFFQGPACFTIFILAMRWGSRDLRPALIPVFLGWFAVYCLAQSASIFLVGTIIACLMLFLGFILGRQSVPWLWLAPAVLVIGFLHLGKSEMRAKYWPEGGQGNLVAPWNYPAFYTEWFQDSLQQTARNKQAGGDEQSIFERASTVNLLLQAQTMTPGDVPFLHGATYALIPSAMTPRLFNPGKVSPLESCTLLNIHFDNQTREQTQNTTIGWGLLAEAYANFGYAGCGVLALVLGAFYALITRMSVGLPPVSLLYLVGVFTLAFTLQTEMTAAVYITAYLQGLFALLVLMFPFTEYVSLWPAGRPGKALEGGRPNRQNQSPKASTKMM